MEVRGLSLVLDEDVEALMRSMGDEDFRKDATGVGLLWEPATALLCDFLQTCAAALLREASVLELGAGLGVAGMLCAKLGASNVVLSDYHPVVLARLHSNVSLNFGSEPMCSVVELPWGESTGCAHLHSLLIGADLAVTERAALKLAATAKARLACDGAFLYAHQERRAVVLAADRSVSREVS